jgi:hypothetical protein
MIILNGTKTIPIVCQQPKRLSVACNQVGQVGDSVSPTRPIVAGCHVGQWLLIVGPPNIRLIMAKVIAGIAREEEVRVLDCGNMLDWFQIQMYLHDKPEALRRVSVEQANSCPEALQQLETMPSIAAPFVVLHLLYPFYNDDRMIKTRKKLLQGCLENLNRLEQFAGGAGTLEKIGYFEGSLSIQLFDNRSQ